MKCPKCGYLGFETGDRCKNCGYDFSLMADAASDRIEIDLDLREAHPTEATDWLARVDVGAPGSAPPEPEPPVAQGPPPALRPTAGPEKLPLFTPAIDDEGDEPLIKLPPTPRPPLAVRRTPETPRLRAFATSVRRVEPAPTPPLQFDAEEERRSPPPIDRRHVSPIWNEPSVTSDVSGSGARAAAAVIDHVMLGGIDLAVVYFTLRMAGLPMDQWTALPPVPLVAFLLLIKLSYFCAFTAVGGQTIGKMAARIRVVTADDQPVDGTAALCRTLAGVLSALMLGLGFLPALLASDRRALHDRMARTRVIALKGV